MKDLGERQNTESDFPILIIKTVLVLSSSSHLILTRGITVPISQMRTVRVRVIKARAYCNILRRWQNYDLNQPPTLKITACSVNILHWWENL